MLLQSSGSNPHLFCTQSNFREVSYEWEDAQVAERLPGTVARAVGDTCVGGVPRLESRTAAGARTVAA